MRKLHSQGVVPTKQAYGTKSKMGTQHSDAIKALVEKGGDVQTGSLKKSAVIGKTKPPPPTKAGPGDGPTQRQMAMVLNRGYTSVSISRSRHSASYKALVEDLRR